MLYHQMPVAIVSLSLKLINTIVYKLVDILANLYSFMNSQGYRERR
jgi:hypothetical protein